MMARPLTSTGTPSGTTTSTPPMIATAVMSMIDPVSSAWRRSTLALPMSANALTWSAGRQRPLAWPPLMMPITDDVVGRRGTGVATGAPEPVKAGGAANGRPSRAVRSAVRVVDSKATPTRSANSSSVMVPSPQWLRRMATTCSRSASVTATSGVEEPLPSGLNGMAQVSTIRADEHLIGSRR